MRKWGTMWCRRKRRTSFALGKDIHKTCLAITEPKLDDEVTGDRVVYMAGVLAPYYEKLVEKTKHFVGTPPLLIEPLKFRCIMGLLYSAWKT